MKERYGTIGFAAPEQENGRSFGFPHGRFTRSGRSFFYAERAVPPGETSGCANFCQNRQMERLIRGCMAREKANRYQTRGEVERALRELPELISKEQAIESLTVVFCRERSREIGTTHAALGISNFLTPKRVSSAVSGSIRYGCGQGPYSDSGTDGRQTRYLRVIILDVLTSVLTMVKR